MTRLNLLVLRSRDPEKLAAFYSALGLEFVEHQHGAGPIHFACENADLVFEIYPAGQEGKSTREIRLGFEVEDVGVAVERLLGEGAELASAPKQSPWGLRAVMVDIEGHKVELTQAPAAVDGR